jgi:hypothetical protein
LCTVKKLNASLSKPFQETINVDRFKLKCSFLCTTVFFDDLKHAPLKILENVPKFSVVLLY